MEIKEKIKGVKISEKRTSTFSEIERSYNLLDGTYHMSLFVGGFCLIWHFDYLNWLTGIACFFLANFVAKLLVRIDFTKNYTNHIKCSEIEDRQYFKPWLN